MLERAVANTNIEYGGFQPSVSNVVFVHGSVDPWHAMGVLEDLSPQATSIYITGDKIFNFKEQDYCLQKYYQKEQLQGICLHSYSYIASKVKI